MKPASEEMLTFVRDLRMIFQSVLFATFNFDEVVIWIRGAVSRCTRFNKAVAASGVLSFILPDCGCVEV